MFKDNLLKNKTIVVTGGGSGLGKSMARRFGELGANLVISGRRKEVLEEAAAARLAARDCELEELVRAALLQHPRPGRGGGRGLSVSEETVR